jgi:pimeloyl-ACP methyl ester carboxylesterase
VTDPAGTQYITVAGTQVRVRIVGVGEPLLLVMGLGGNLDMWEPLAGQLTGRQLIMFDFPGTGHSGAQLWPPTMGMNSLFVKSLLTKLGHTRVDVLGYSWGGLLAQHLAAQHPRTVRRLVLAATSVGLGGMPPSARVAATMLTPRRYYSQREFARVAPRLYGGPLRNDPELVAAEAARRVGRPPSVGGYLAQLAAITGYSTLPVLPFIGCPVLVLGGDDDPLAPACNLRLIAHMLRHAELCVLPGAGHLLLFDRVDDAAPVIRSFLERPVLRRQ